MAQQLKRWESPRRSGRNDKGKGGSARQRQRRKQFQRLRQQLKQQSNQTEKGGNHASLFDSDLITSGNPLKSLEPLPQ